ncbi:MAG: hypothetical protein ACOX0Z_01405 [Candidatus Nanosyncoccaceae bacterium]|jgi:hypothetical protein
MNSDTKNAVSVKHERKNRDKNRAKLNVSVVLPWGLLILSLIVMIVFNTQKPARIENGNRVCTEDIISKYNEINSMPEGEGKSAEYKTLMEKINSIKGSENDPTCVYISVRRLFSDKNYDKAFFEAERLGSLYKKGLIVDSRKMSVTDLDSLKSNIMMFKAIETENNPTGDKVLE